MGRRVGLRQAGVPAESLAQCFPGSAFEDGKCVQGLQNMQLSSFPAANQEAWRWLGFST